MSSEPLYVFEGDQETHFTGITYQHSLSQNCNHSVTEAARV